MSKRNREKFEREEEIPQCSTSKIIMSNGEKFEREKRIPQCSTSKIITSNGEKSERGEEEPQCSTSKVMSNEKKVQRKPAKYPLYRMRYRDMVMVPKHKKFIFGLLGTEADNEEISFEEVFWVYKTIEARLHGLKKSITDMQELAVGVLSPQREPVISNLRREEPDNSDAFEDSRENTLEELRRLTTPMDENTERAERAEGIEQEMRKREKPKKRKRLTRREFYAMVQETERAERRVHLQMEAVRHMMGRFPQRIIRPLIQFKNYLLLMLQF